MRPCLVLCVLCALAAPVPADDNLQLGTSLVLASETHDPESAGHHGLALVASTWSGSLGGAIEVGRHGWSWDTRMQWVRGSLRLAIADGAVCGPRDCVYAKPWLDVGLAREEWTVEEPRFDTTHLARTTAHAGIGVDMQLFRAFGVAAFFRVQRGEAPVLMTEAGWPATGPYETSLVFGTSLLFGPR